MTRKERRRFFNMAYASHKEVETLLIIMRQQQLLKQCDILGAIIFCLQRQALAKVPIT